MVHIVVRITRILDPDTPRGDFNIDAETRQVQVRNPKYVISPFDENALELAMQIKDRHPQTMVTALSLGPPRIEVALRKALSVGADRAVRVHEEGSGELDSFASARILARAVQELGDGDLIFCGLDAGDLDVGQVGPVLAEELGWSCATLVHDTQVVDGTVQVERQIDEGHEVLALNLPAVVTVTNAAGNQLRMPKVKDVMLSRQKPITVWQFADLGLDATETVAAASRGMVFDDLFVPVVNKHCELIRGETPAQKALALVQELRNRRLL